MTEPKALREKLDEMVEAEYKARDYINPAFVYEVIALDLLARLDAAETPCVWSVDADGILRPSCGRKRWHQAEVDDAFCSGCGHPVQVKQPQDAAEEK